MGDHAIALLQEVEHLGVPVVAAQWPAMVEYDRLRPLRAPILVENRRSVTGCDRRHSSSPCLPGRSARERPPETCDSQGCVIAFVFQDAPGLAHRLKHSGADRSIGRSSNDTKV